MQDIQNLSSQSAQNQSYEAIDIPNQSQNKKIEYTPLIKNSSSNLPTFLKSLYSSILLWSKYEGGSVTDGILTLLAATIGTGIDLS